MKKETKHAGDIVHTCKVTVTLKKSQQQDDGMWKFTYKGKQLETFNRDIAWYAQSHEEALTSFNIEEVDKYTINLRTDYFPY